jgi:hypothetical protein
MPPSVQSDDAGIPRRKVAEIRMVRRTQLSYPGASRKMSSENLMGS